MMIFITSKCVRYFRRQNYIIKPIAAVHAKSFLKLTKYGYLYRTFYGYELDQLCNLGENKKS